jgi:hypothetical protein
MTSRPFSFLDSDKTTSSKMISVAGKSIILHSNQNSNNNLAPEDCRTMEQIIDASMAQKNLFIFGHLDFPCTKSINQKKLRKLLP